MNIEKTKTKKMLFHFKRRCAVLPFHLVTHLNWHQTASNSVNQTSVLMWRGLQVLYQVKIHDKMLFEVDYGWGSVWLSLPTSLTACSPPFAPDYTREKRELFWISVTPASKSYIDLYYYANSGCHGVYAKKPRKGRNISAGGLWLKCSPLPVL